jgi:hypothetical protein
LVLTVFRRLRRRKRSAEALFADRWCAWWEATGRAEIMRLLEEHGVPTDSSFNGPYWSEAEAIGDVALWGYDANDLQSLLEGFAEDLGADADPEQDAAAAQAINDWLDAHSPIDVLRSD